jgi:hypothetical protein
MKIQSWQLAATFELNDAPDDLNYPRSHRSIVIYRCRAAGTAEEVTTVEVCQAIGGLIQKVEIRVAQRQHLTQ